MAPRKTRKNNRNGNVLNVRSGGAVSSFEKLLSKGPLTMVFIKASWCGACHRFNDEVWDPLTKLKKKNVNLAAVDSEVIGKTSLANVPRKFYPTILLVGKDKKPAVFKDETGLPTNSMPRNSSLAEDREEFTKLVQAPLAKANNGTRKNTANSQNNKGQNQQGQNQQGQNQQGQKEEQVESATSETLLTANQNMGKTAYLNKKKNIAPSLVNASVAEVPLAKVPVAEVPVAKVPVANNTRKQNKRISPPDVASDLYASQTKSVTSTAAAVSEPTKGEPTKGGRMLRAIREKAASLKALLRMRSSNTRRK